MMTMQAMQVEETKSEKGKAAAMGLPHITSFCWCMGLEMGARLIAVMHLLVSLCLVIACSIYAAKFSELAGTVEDAGDHVYSAWYTISVCVAVVSTGHVLLAYTLLVGVYKRKTVLLRVWTYLMCLLYLAAVLFNVVGIALTGVASTGSDIFLAFLEGVLFFGLLAYCILCVNSYYLMLKSCEDMEGPQGTQY